MVKYPTYVRLFLLTKYDMGQFAMMDLFSCRLKGNRCCVGDCEAVSGFPLDLENLEK